MMKKLALLILTATLMVNISCSKSSEEPVAAQQQQPIELSYSIFFPPSHAQCKAGIAWAEEIEKRSKGAVKINVFPGGTLTKANEVYDGVVKGISAIGMSCFAYTRGRFPTMEALDLPLGYPSGKAATRIANEFYGQLQPEELKDVKLLYLHAHGPGLLHTQNPVRTLDDLKGMKIRSTGLSAKVVEALGAIPVAMPQGGTYEALQKGVVEGTFAPIETLKGWKQAEVVDFTTDCRQIGYTTTMFVVMNLDKWNSLPQEIKNIFTEVSNEWIEVQGNVWDEADSEGRNFTMELDNQVLELPPGESLRWRQAVEPVINNYIKTAEAKQVDGARSVELLRKLVASETQNG